MFVFYIFVLFIHFLHVYTKSSFSDVSLIRVIRNTKSSIVEDKSCNEVKSMCRNLSENDDLLILECLLSVDPDRLGNLNKECQHVIWNHRKNLIEDRNVKGALLATCSHDLDGLNCKSDGNGNYLKCIVTNIGNIRNAECVQKIIRLENVAFTDYMWISSFLKHCTKDIDLLKCGRIDPQSLTQINTVSCLQDNVFNIEEPCRREVFHLSELQSENIKRDIQLYSDCSDDYARYCSDYQTGSGRVLSCLMQQMHQDQAKLKPICRQHLLRRQKLIAEDYRISRGLLKACKEDIKKTHCRKQVSSDKTVRLAQILLCLEDMVKNGTKIDSECETEIVDHRRMLMEDYRLSPEIVNNCKSEILGFCKGFKTGGKTIHCLMDHALLNTGNSKARIQDKCMRALEDLVRETDVGENWNVDPVLHQACDPVVKVACKGLSGGNARVMSCLMDKLGTDYMNEDCENALIQIQYFVARDFKLDPQLYKGCYKDAVRYCHVNPDNFTGEGPSYGIEVLPCLYRYAYLPQDAMALEKNCLKEIRRVMRQRAISVNLQPEIEEMCLKDLSFYCHDKLKKGEEMQCLQNNLENLEEKCLEAVESFTEIEAQHADLNPYISKYCKHVIEQLCNVDANSDEGNIMDCLIDNKNNPIIKSNHACRASIEHFQIISIQDYRFTYKFKLACKTHAIRLCSHARSKYEVVACLSEQLLNATVHGLKSSISKDCKQQLRSQIFHQRENIEYDPSLKAACAADIDKYCKTLHSGNSQVLECLQTVSPGDLSRKCEKEVFKVKKLEIYDNTVDYTLLTTCAETIDQFCPYYNRENVLNCLKENKDQKGFSKKCRMIVLHRMIEQNENYLLNPTLQKNCLLDIRKYCKNELSSNEKLVGDAVIKCLKTQFKLSKLSDVCEKELAEVLKEQALNINLNPLVKVVCKNEINTICKFKEEDSAKVEECLKTALISKNIPTPECRLEVANMIEESQADIQVDPLLQRICALDLLTYCHDVPQGNGRHIQCLKNIMDSRSQNLTPNCKMKLRERLEMYKNAAQITHLRDIQDLYQQLVSSPSKIYFMIMIFVVFTGIFVIGILCGQVTRNKYTLLKNK
ncbi:hypothetical protein NQ315_016184 [Exocentrus adspersus]|uniref:Golgi apparatus protein 1 n=1 Tax=Exocentrus adspersus TaxID=1586481 RepID=A0AAV8V7N8_9CUCU|nr:hypothetical protein NQ315_016184 [Exocentrus adspersus]